MTGLTDELRTHSLKEYISYLDNLKMILMTQEPVDEVITKNWNSFIGARDFMKTPIVKDNSDYLDEISFSGGGGYMTIELPSEEQQENARRVKEAMDKIGPIQEILEPFKTESAEQYITAIHTFEEAQDTFFQGFLINKEPSSLDDYFKETLI